MTGALARMLDLPAGDTTHGLVYGLLAALTVVGAVHGYRLLLRLSRFLAVGMIVLLALGLVAYAPALTTAAPADAPWLLGSFWPTWALSAVAAGLTDRSRSSRSSVTTPATSRPCGTAPGPC